MARQAQTTQTTRTQTKPDPKPNPYVDENGDPIHLLDKNLVGKQLTIDLVGCGGTGSQVLTGLARLHLAMLALGHPGGLRVNAYDPDTVSAANVGRQLFYPADIGRAKADVLVNRLNLCFGLDWESRPTRYQVTGGRRAAYDLPNIVITCVDTAKTRREIAAAFEQLYLPPPEYWLDCGNAQQSGQVYLTQPPSPRELGILTSDQFREGVRSPLQPLPGRLPRLEEVIPNIFESGFVEDDRPSCSLAEALAEQDLFINQHMASWALQILWKLLREGRITHHGCIINLQSYKVLPIPVPSQKVIVSEPTPQTRCRKGATNG